MGERTLPVDVTKEVRTQFRGHLFDRIGANVMRVETELMNFLISGLCRSGDLPLPCTKYLFVDGWDREVEMDHIARLRCGLLSNVTKHCPT